MLNSPNFIPFGGTMRLCLFACFLPLVSLFAAVEESILPAMEAIYREDFGHKINKHQREQMLYVRDNQPYKLRFMTYNMLYNAQDAEDKLPPKHRWDKRKGRLQEYLAFAKADIIGSQELQDDQVPEVLALLGPHYGCYGEKTRVNEGRSDTNAIYYNKERVELMETKTVPFKDERCQNAFTYCLFKDKVNGTHFAVLNTKLSWGSPDRRLAEAEQMNHFGEQIKDPLILLGDFNLYPCTLHKRNIFLDGEYVERALAGNNLQDAKNLSIFGFFGPLCSITNSKQTLEPFIGPELTGFILDHILVNRQVLVCTLGIDSAKVDGEYPSDHFPVIADLLIKP